MVKTQRTSFIGGFLFLSKQSKPVEEAKERCYRKHQVQNEVPNIWPALQSPYQEDDSKNQQADS